MEQTLYSFTAKSNSGKEQKLLDYKGKVLLIVNTASKCGFTKQFSALQELYDKYKDQGFYVLAFPCNQFANQEPGSAEEISNFCKLNYGVTFPIFEKVLVNGENAHPVFKFLETNAPGIFGTKMIKWNFTKFLINKQGIPVERFSPSTTPDKIEKYIKALL